MKRKLGIIIIFLVIFALSFAYLNKQRLPKSSNDSQLAQPANTPILNQVEITTAKSSYQTGEDVEYKIINNSNENIYYTWGCSLPTPTKLGEKIDIPMLVDILENEKPVLMLAPGETRICTWDQKVWQDPSKEGTSRFKSYLYLAPVPPGQYQFRLAYTFDESTVDLGAASQISYSNKFTIE